MKKEIRTSIKINATHRQVWNTLVQTEKYPEWNPFITSFKGSIKVGEQVVAHIEPPGQKGMTFKPTILEVIENKTFRWLGKLFIKGLFDGEHIFEMIDNGDGTTTFIQREKFTGILVGLILKMIGNNTKAGFELMNETLKSKVEEEHTNTI
jgi:hypothetical protein